MAKKWLDSIEKQKEEAMFVANRPTDGQTDRWTDRVNDKKIIDS